jgi:hypothetical protein
MRRWNLLFLGGGVALLALLVGSIGPHELLDRLGRMGWGFAGMCAVHVGVLLCDALVLALCTKWPMSRAWVLSCFRASVAGHAINSATPMGQIGDLTKFTLLAETAPKNAVAAALILQNLLSMLVGCVAIVLLPPLALSALSPSPALTQVTTLASILFSVVFVAALAVVRAGPGELPFRLALRLGLSASRVDRARAAWQRVEALCRQAARERLRMSLAILATVCSVTLSALEIAVILHATGVPASLALTAVTLAMTQVVMWLTSMIPLQAGSAEGGAYLLFRELGLSPHAGVILELCKKARRIVFLCLGVTVLGVATFREHARGPAPEAPGLVPSDE